MAAQDVATIQAFINSNFTTNGSNNITGAELQTVLINLTDSFYNSVSTTAVTGSGTTNYITKWATGSTAGAGTWTMIANAFVPVNNNSTLGSAALGIQSFHAAATSTTASINIKSSAATDPSTPIEGMLWYNGTNLYFRDSSSSVDLLAAATLGGSGTANTMALFTASGTVGDSYMTQTAAGTALLTKNLGIGIAADATIMLYVEAGAADAFPVWVDQSYTGGNDVDALFARSKGVNAGINIGGNFNGQKSTDLNIGVKATAGDTGISFNPSSDGFDRIGSVMQTASQSTLVVSAFYSSVNGAGTVTSYGGYIQGSNSSSGDVVGLYIDAAITSGTAYIGQWKDGNEEIGKVMTCVSADGKAQWGDAGAANATHTGDATGATALTLATVNSDVGSYVKPTITVNAKGLVTAVTSEIMGGLVVTSTSTTNVSNGSYNVLEDTTALTSVSSGIGQDSDWTLEVTQTGITNQKGRVSAVIKCEKTGGAGRQYDFAIFKNGSIISDSEMTDLTLENNDTWSNIKCTAPVEFSTGDLFSLRVSGNGTGDDIECTNGTIYIQ